MNSFMPRGKMLLLHSILVLLFAVAIVHPQEHPTPTTNLTDKILVLRGFYRADKLYFREDGTLIEEAAKGFGPTDALFHIRGFEPHPKAVLIKGDLPVVYFDTVSGKVSYARGLAEREVIITMENGNDPDAVDRALWKVFYRPEEAPLPSCTADENESFRSLQASRIAGQPQGVLHSGSELCLPLGERHLASLGAGVTFPRATFSPDPDFSEEGRQQRLQGTEVLSVVVDSEGHASTVMIVRPLGHGFDEQAAKAVHSWKFEPSTRNGQPVAVLVNIEVGFHLDGGRDITKH